MKLKLFILLIVLLGCRSHMSSLHSVTSNYLMKQGNFSLHALQFLTVEMKREQGQWPESKLDYVQSFSDSVNILFSDFNKLEFEQKNDTLIVFYQLKDPKKISRFSIEFERIEQYNDSSKVRFESDYREIKNESKFKENEGRISFYELNANKYSIIHQYKRGISKNKITTAQQ